MNFILINRSSTSENTIRGVFKLPTQRWNISERNSFREIAEYLDEGRDESVGGFTCNFQIQCTIYCLIKGTR